MLYFDWANGEPAAQIRGFADASSDSAGGREFSVGPRKVSTNLLRERRA